MIIETLQKLSDMRLYAMSGKLREIEETAKLSELSPIEVITFMVDAEHDKRKKNRINRLKNKAKMKLPSACIQDIKYSEKRNLRKENMYDIITGNFLKSNQNILVSGKTGVGKTFLSNALANMACVNGLTTMYFRVSKFLEYIVTEQTLGNYLKIIEKTG